MALKDALSKVKMPARAAEEDEMLEMDIASEDEEMLPEDEEMPEEGSDLSSYSDEEILAEFKARGLKLEDEEAPEVAEDEEMEIEA